MAEIIGTETEQLIPTEIHGFTVRMELGPYPLNAEHTHRKALYAVFTPATYSNIEKLRYVNAREIRGMLPLTAEQTTDLLTDPNQPRCEHLHAIAFQKGLERAREVASA